MSDLNPSEVYGRYRRKELDAASTLNYLKSIIESGSEVDSRVRSLEFLAKMELNELEDFDFLENLVASDTNSNIRQISAEIITNQFLEKGENLLKWIFKNENSADCLLGIYNALTNKETVLTQDLLNKMEETIGIYYMIHYDLVPKEAMGLELLSKHLCFVYPFEYKLDKWYFENLKIENQKVISITIENLHSSIDSKFFSLFSGLRELILYDCKLRNAYFLGGISRLRIEGMEQGPLGSLDEIEGFENLNNLKELNLYYNSISEISKLENLTKLERIDLSHNYIKEIKGLDTLKNLQSLNLEGNEIEEIKNLENLVNLRDLNLSENKEISEIKGLEKLLHLEELLLFNNYLIKEIKGLENLRNLKILVISKDTGEITSKVLNANIEWVAPFQEGMDVYELTRKQEILNKMHDDYWKKLYEDREYIGEIKGLETLINLEELYLDGNSILEINGLERLKNLKILNLSENKIKEIKGLERLKKLETLNLNRNKIKEIIGLENLKYLKSLFLHDNNIAPIEGLEDFENNSCVKNPQKFVEYCYKKKKI